MCQMPPNIPKTIAAIASPTRYAAFSKSELNHLLSLKARGALKHFLKQLAGFLELFFRGAHFQDVLALNRLPVHHIVNRDFDIERSGSKRPRDT